MRHSGALFLFPRVAEWTDGGLELRDIVLAALDEAPVGKPLLGATLGLLASKIAASNGLVFKDELKRQGLSLKRLLGKMPDEVQLAPAAYGPDFVISRAGEGPTALNEEAEPRKLRRDVYIAFTRLRSGLLFYNAVHDRFRQESPDGSGNIPVPPIAIGDLVDDRRSFAESINDAALSNTLLGSLQDRTTALTSFKQAVDDADLQANWHRFNGERVRKRLQTWASSNGLPLRPEWQHVEQATARDPRNTLSEVARHMTDDEVRNLTVPVRAVEALMLLRGIKL